MDKALLSVQAWGAEFRSTVSTESLYMVVHTCNLNTGRWRQENLGDLLAHKCSQSVNTGFSDRPPSQKKKSWSIVEKEHGYLPEA